MTKLHGFLMMPAKCSIPFCRGNYDKQNTVHIFSLPIDEDEKKKWERAIPKEDFTFSKTSRVCERHFKLHEIRWQTEAFNDKTGKTICVRLTKPRLHRGVIPSVFPECPTYLSKGMPVLEPADSACEMEVDLPPSLVHTSENGLNWSATEPVKFDGVVSCRTMAQIKLKESSKEQMKKFYDATIKVKSLVNETEGFSKRIRNFIDTKSFLFVTPVKALKTHPQLKNSSIYNFVSNGPSTAVVKESLPTADGLEVVTVVSSRDKGNLPPAGEMKRDELKPGTEVWVMKSSSVDVFVEGTVLSVRDADPEKWFKVRFEETKGTAPKLYTAKQLAYRTPSAVIVPVGTRIVARYSDGIKPRLYAGIVSEPPKITNHERYLIFFDDGYAQYIYHKDIYVVCSQSIDVADDVHENISDFIRSYLQKYPERPMVKLQKHQITKTEYDRKWWDTKVLDVDASMVKMYFMASHRIEWIYRGSTRLKLLYNELANAEANRIAGKHRRHHNVPRKPHQPYVEYTRDPGDVVTIDSGSDEENKNDVDNQNARRKPGDKPKNTARKSTAMKPRSSLGVSGKYHSPDIKSHLGYKDLHNFPSFERSKYRVHDCSVFCRERESPVNYRGRNPFFIPILLGWERQLRKFRRSGPKVLVMYRAPCGRHLRDLQEIQDYLIIVSSRVTIDYFSLEPNLVVFRSFRPKEVLYETNDVTQGRENVPVCCVNSWSKDPPPFVEYASKRYPGKGVDLNEDKEFLCGCTCTDNCQNALRCECQQITNFAHSGNLYGEAGYKFRRLKEPIYTGLYECNDRCKCGPRCGNRVVQNGLQVRLQMFKTQNKGWGIRCLDDLDAGMFICIYAGQLLTEQGAEEDGKQLGDEYLAELDHIEVVERTKEGYESDVSDMENMDLDDESETKKEDDDDSKSEEPSPNSSDSEINICDTDSDFESSLRNTATTTYTTRSRKKSRLKNSDTSSNVSTSSLGTADDSSSNHTNERKTIAKELPDITTALDSFTIIPCPLSPASAELVDKTEFKRTPIISEHVEFSSATAQDVWIEETNTEYGLITVQKPPKVKYDWSSDSKTVAKKSISMKHPVAPLIPSVKQKGYKSIRSFYGENSLFIMDAKSKGNIGRYLNHSCAPNLFVQSVFVGTHDLRFHEVAFFAQHFIPAGTELTWDYNYEVGSVPNKVMYCYCDARNCRGRLL